MSDFTATDAYLGVGSNQGSRFDHIAQAVMQLDAHPDIAVVQVSSAYKTEAHRRAGQREVPWFLNGVLHLRTTLSPQSLLTQTQAQEYAAGRRPAARWAPRPLDLDVLTVGSQQHTTARLTVPHPRLDQRRFVLQPWAELAPNLWVPDPFDATVCELLKACTDTHALQCLSRPLVRFPFSSTHVPPTAP